MKIFNLPSVKISAIEEKIMLESVLENARKFYEDPKNVQAFEAWKKEKENKNYGTNNFNP